MKGYSGFLFVAVVFLLAGCGGTDKDVPTTAPVSGVVKYKGSAVEGAIVSLMPAAGSTGLKPATGTTDSSGHFTVSTYIGGADQAEGAMPGDYVVTVTKTASQAMTPAQMGAQMQGQGQGTTAPPEGGQAVAPAATNQLPEKYAAGETSGFTVTVDSDGVSDLNLDLVD